MKFSQRQLIFVFFGVLVILNAGLSWFFFVRPAAGPPLTWQVVAYLAGALLLGAALAYLLSALVAGQSLSAALGRAGAGLDEEACRRMVYVGADSFREGRTCGDIMGKLLQGNGTVLTVTGLQGQALEIRKTGFMAILQETYPGIRVVHQIDGHGDSESVYPDVIAACKRFPNLSGIYVVDGNSPQVVARALHEAGRAGQIRLVCHDLVDETMRAMQAGVVTATISQDPFSQGHDPVIYLYNYLVAGQKPPRPRMTTQMDRITLENYRQFWDPERGAIENEAMQERRARPVSARPARPLRILVLGREDVTFFDPLKRGALAAAEELKDCDTLVEWVEPGKARKERMYGAAEYGPAIEHAIVKKYDAIVVPVYDKALVPYINRAVDAGIPVATINSEPNNLHALMSTLITQSQELRDISVALAQSAAESGERAGQINQAIGEMQQALAVEVQSAMQALDNTSQMAQAVTNISSGASEQTAAAYSVSEAIGDISGAVEGTNQAALVSEQTAGQAVQIARSGAQTIQQTLGQIKEISDVVRASAEKIHTLDKLSRQIGGIVNTVSDIAEQTNMLALNANIEAARAGEHGRGFAVVANEVRSLAELSKKSNKEISQLIRAVQGNASEIVVAADAAVLQAQAGSQLAAQAGQSLEALLQAAETMRVQTEKVVQATASVLQALNRLTQANQRVTTVINENASATQQVTENIHQTVQMVNHMSGISKDNATAIEGIHKRSDEVADRSQRLRANTAALVQMAEELQGAVAAFTVSQE